MDRTEQSFVRQQREFVFCIALTFIGTFAIACLGTL
jgi:hypothetical protein